MSSVFPQIVERQLIVFIIHNNPVISECVFVCVPRWNFVSDRYLRDLTSEQSNFTTSDLTSDSRIIIMSCDRVCDRVKWEYNSNRLTGSRGGSIIPV